MNDILHLAGYKFIAIHDLLALRLQLMQQCKALALKGTILLSEEGINVMLAGTVKNMQAFAEILQDDTRFANMSFHQTSAARLPFQHLKVKIKKEIITFHQHVEPSKNRAPSVSPLTLKQWLTEKRAFTLLDTRNHYEIAVGTFVGAQHLSINDFCAFPQAVSSIPRDKPIVTFCTGGIRCEKAALYLMQQGYDNVYQLEGGILGYFAKAGGAHYQGDCFVFDDRGAVDTQLKSILNA